VLATLEDPQEAAEADDGVDGGDGRGCKFCGGLGHRAATCPKLESQRMKAVLSASGGGAGGRVSGDAGGGGDW
jgi:ATP-dependent RNA helicase DDX41